MTDKSGGTTQADPRPLSERLLEVLTCVAQGMSNAATGKHLCISPHTVKNQLTRIERQLGVGNRTAAVAKAMKRGWIVLEDDPVIQVASPDCF